VDGQQTSLPVHARPSRPEKKKKKNVAAILLLFFVPGIDAAGANRSRTLASDISGKRKRHLLFIFFSFDWWTGWTGKGGRAWTLKTG